MMVERRLIAALVVSGIGGLKMVNCYSMSDFCLVMNEIFSTHTCYWIVIYMTSYCGGGDNGRGFSCLVSIFFLCFYKCWGVASPASVSLYLCMYNLNYLATVCIQT